MESFSISAKYFPKLNHANFKFTKIGNSVSLILPKEVMARLKLEKGDVVFLTDAPSAVTITPHDLKFEDQMTLARKIMKQCREVLCELAK